MSTAADMQPVEIHLGRAQLYFALGFVAFLLIGCLGIALVPRLTTAHGYLLSLRCLPDLHLTDHIYQYPVPQTTPTTYHAYQEVMTGACDISAGSPVLSSVTKKVACRIPGASTIAPGRAALLLCQPVGTPETAQHLIGVCLAQNRDFLGQDANDEHFNGVCTVWVEAASYHA